MATETSKGNATAATVDVGAKLWALMGKMKNLRTSVRRDTEAGRYTATVPGLPKNDSDASLEALAGVNGVKAGFTPTDDGRGVSKRFAGQADGDHAATFVATILS